ncbi:MAG: hypothetical protein COY80_00985 [Candidatus Pacebacteria bacterium CG_4_10_14_0_8_um_filter_42_14]|nr:MAG: hypothetical protein COY80_00985 [Candidatus Pacebacteria bacterium CG_4_10_14_0_8_um_filter_42_14]
MCIIETMKHITRPHIICHMMQTLDGKIASGIPGQEIIMDYFDLYTVAEAKLDSKVWMFGRKTASSFAEPFSDLPHSESEDIEGDHVAQSQGDTFAVVIDTQGSLRWDKNYINLSNQSKEFHLITVVTNQTPKEYLSYLRDKDISYIICGGDNVDLNNASLKLSQIFEIEKVLLEGGGSFNGSMMAQGLVDEISLLLLPRVLNKKDAPSLFDQETSELMTTNYRLQSFTELERDVLWLRYAR